MQKPFTQQAGRRKYKPSMTQEAGTWRAIMADIDSHWQGLYEDLGMHLAGMVGSRNGTEQVTLDLWPEDYDLVLLALDRLGKS